MIIGIDDEESSGKFPGSPISPLQVDLIQETGHRLHLKITDPINKRWEIPERLAGVCVCTCVFVYAHVFVCVRGILKFLLHVHVGMISYMFSM